MFRLVDAILESNLWPLTEEDLEDENVEEIEEAKEDQEEKLEEGEEDLTEEEEEEACPDADCNSIKWVH